MDLADEETADHRLLETNSFNKEVASTYNDGYRDGLSAGSTKGFLDEFEKGFNSSFAILMKLFQLNFMADRCLRHCKNITLSQSERKILDRIHEMSILVNKEATSNFIKLSKRAEINHGNHARLPDQVSELKLFEDEEALSQQNLYKDLQQVHDYLNDRKSWSCFQNTQINEILVLIREIVVPGGAI